MNERRFWTLRWSRCADVLELVLLSIVLTRTLSEGDWAWAAFAGVGVLFFAAVLLGAPARPEDKP